MTSTPTYSDVGISVEYENCTQQWQWQISCLHCGEYQFPEIEHFTWKEQDPSDIQYSCQYCGAMHNVADEHKLKMSAKWVCISDQSRKRVGFWMNQFCSSFSRWEETIRDWVDAQGDPARMQVVYNTAFAQDWEGVGEKVDVQILEARAETFDDQIDSRIELITIGADVQADRIECEVVGWAENRESWSLDYQVLPGEPTAPDVWEQLDDVFDLTWVRADDIILPVAVLCVDAGAFTQHVYEYIKQRKHPGIIPIKGAGGMDRDQIDNDVRLRQKRTAKRLKNGKPAEIVGVDSIKRTIFQYFTVAEGENGYCHFPTGRSREYYEQLTGERLEVVQVRGKRPQRRWKPIHPNVEALDCRVYAYAAMLMAGTVRPRQIKPPPKPPQSAIQESKKNSFIKPRQNFIRRR